MTATVQKGCSLNKNNIASFDAMFQYYNYKKYNISRIHMSESSIASSSSPSFSTPIRSSASTRSRFCSRRPTRRSTTTSESSKQPFVGDFRLSGTVFPRQSAAKPRSMKPNRYVPASKDKIRRGRVSTAADHLREDARAGQVSKVTR